MKSTLSKSASFGDQGGLTLLLCGSRVAPKAISVYPNHDPTSFFFFQFQLVQPFLFEKQSIAITILPWPVARHPRAGASRLTDTPREGKVREQNILDTCVSERGS